MPLYKKNKMRGTARHIAMVFMLLPILAYATSVYKCKVENGETIYADRPCPNAKVEVIHKETEEEVRQRLHREKLETIKTLITSNRLDEAKAYAMKYDMNDVYDLQLHDYKIYFERKAADEKRRAEEQQRIAEEREARIRQQQQIAEQNQRIEQLQEELRRRDGIGIVNSIDAPSPGAIFYPQVVPHNESVPHYEGTHHHDEHHHDEHHHDDSHNHEGTPHPTIGPLGTPRVPNLDSPKGVIHTIGRGAPL